MHEVALIQGILTTCFQQAGQEQAVAIRSITLEIGQFAGISEEALQFGFDVAKRGTLASESILKIEGVIAQGTCSVCGARLYGVESLDECKHCGGRLALESGRELRIKSMEIEECVKTVAV